jgi:hypothetical protein
MTSDDLFMCLSLCGLDGVGCKWDIEFESNGPHNQLQWA